MTITERDPASHTSRLARAVRTRWPVPVVVAAALTATQLLLTARYDVGGHAAEHLASASVPFMAAAVVVLLFWATPPALRQADLLAATCAWFAATLFVMAGNLRVVDDLVGAGFARTPTGSVPDVADHSLANSSVWWAAGVAIVVVVAWRLRGHIGNRATIGALAATVVIPPWFIPGAGVVVLAIVRLVLRGRGERAAQRSVATKHERVPFAP